MPPTPRPVFATCWKHFQDINLPVADVGKKIGGKVQINIDLPYGGFANACPIRISYVLNRAGVPIPGPKSGHSVVSGGDNKWYMYRVKEMIKFLERAWGQPEVTASGADPVRFAGAKGIIAVQGSGWVDASGHVTLWNGARCLDSCHLASDPDNGTFVPSSAVLWVLR